MEQGSVREQNILRGLEHRVARDEFISFLRSCPSLPLISRIVLTSQLGLRRIGHELGSLFGCARIP